LFTYLQFIHISYGEKVEIKSITRVSNTGRDNLLYISIYNLYEEQNTKTCHG